MVCIALENKVTKRLERRLKLHQEIQKLIT